MTRDADRQRREPGTHIRNHHPGTFDGDFRLSIAPLFIKVLFGGEFRGVGTSPVSLWSWEENNRRLAKLKLCSTSSFFCGRFLDRSNRSLTTLGDVSPYRFLNTCIQLPIWPLRYWAPRPVE